MAFCRNCGVQMADGAAFCPGCGTSQTTAASTTPGAAPVPAGQPAATAAPMTSNVAGLLCYILGFITGIIFLVIEPYKNDKFVRFHAFQSIFLSVTLFAISLVWTFLFTSMFLMSGMWTILWGLYTIIRLLFFIVWIFVMFKAYNNEQYKLPIIGEMAAKQAGV